MQDDNHRKQNKENRARDVRALLIFALLKIFVSPKMNIRLYMYKG